MDEDHLGIIITVSCIMVLLVSFQWLGIFQGGYTVEPATDADIANSTPLETKEVTFWELPPRVMILYLALSVSPLLVYPVELLFLLKIFGLFGYRMITSRSVLANETRRRIFEMIQANPGIRFTEISRATGVKPGSLRYHLGILRMSGKITGISREGRPGYFENGNRFSKLEKAILKHMKNRTSRKIFRLLMATREMSRAGIAEELGISRPSVTWYIHQLHHDGIIDVRTVNRNAMYTIREDACPILRDYMQKIQEGIVKPREISSTAAGSK
ncbi:MAG: winged helix-turn-helix transcriptional regulator [Methanoregulaceae archaeon]